MSDIENRYNDFLQKYRNSPEAKGYRECMKTMGPELEQLRTTLAEKEQHIKEFEEVVSCPNGIPLSASKTERDNCPIGTCYGCAWDRFWSYQVRALTAESQLTRAKDIIRALKRGTDCWCEIAIGHPLFMEHSVLCKRARNILEADND